MFAVLCKFVILVFTVLFNITEYKLVYINTCIQNIVSMLIYLNTCIVGYQYVVQRIREEIFLHDFIVILKQILKRCFLVTASYHDDSKVWIIRN